MDEKIILNDVCKDYITYEKERDKRFGFFGLFSKKQIVNRALDNVKLSISRGEIVGIIGPNGAGKTTLIKVLTGILGPTSGKVSVFGFTPNELKYEFKKKIALVSGQKSQLFFDLCAYDTFLLLKKIYELTEEEFNNSLIELTELLQVEDLIYRPVRNLSLGERMKMEIVAALLHNPPILFLDEPTIGMDCISQSNLHHYLLKINDIRNTTILLTSHDFQDISSVCGRCIVINKGKIINDATVEQLVTKFSYKKIIKVYLSSLAGMENTEIIRDKSLIKCTNECMVFEVDPREVGRYYNMLCMVPEVLDILIENEEIGQIIERVYSDEK